MDNQELVQIESKARSIIGDITELKEQIARYKGGADAFISSTDGLLQLSEAHLQLAQQTGALLEQIKNSDAAAFEQSVQKLTDAVSNLDYNISTRLDTLEEKLIELDERTKSGVKAKLFGKV